MLGAKSGNEGGGIGPGNDSKADYRGLEGLEGDSQADYTG